jgi:hypothetical protein
MRATDGAGAFTRETEGGGVVCKHAAARLGDRC